MRLGWFDAVRARNYHRDLYSIYKSWTESEKMEILHRLSRQAEDMFGDNGTMTVLLKELKDSNELLAQTIQLSNGVVTPARAQHKAVPASQYVDPDCISVMPWADDIAKGIFPLDLDGKETVTARTVYWALQRFYGPNTKPDAQLISALQVAISEIMRGKHVVFADLAKPPRQITREQVERCILRATNSRRDIIPTYTFADAVDNLMELISDAR